MIANQYVWTALCSLLLLLSGCHKEGGGAHDPEQPLVVKEALTKVLVTDHSGISETITNAERLKDLAKRNYLEPQSHQKVVRVFARDREGSSKSVITSYYDNGQIHQYLECLNGRASGLYLEWYPTGQKKAQARVLSGQADVDEKALPTWSFDGVALAFDEQGRCTARFAYEHGELNGCSETYFSNGQCERHIPYKNGLQDGEELVYNEQGAVIERLSYRLGAREGACSGFYDGGALAWSEEYRDNHLIEATYLSPSGETVSSVHGGVGTRSVFEDGVLSSQEEICDGLPRGWTVLFNPDGSVERKYQVRDGKKDGVELRYFPEPGGKPRISIEWKDGAIHGVVKTWYPNGTVESQREMCQNLRQGTAMAWFDDGSLMLVEEYSEDKLMRGLYHKKGETVPTSTIENGCGTATIFDSSGAVVETIRYCEGRPQVDS